VVAGALLAAAAAAAFEAGYVLQAVAARQVAAGRPAGLLARLLRRRAFFASLALGGVGFGLQALALGRAPLAVVQPVLALGLIGLLVLARIVLDEHVGRPELLGALAIAVGAGAAVAVAPSVEGTPGDAAWLGLGGLAAVTVAALASRGRAAALLVAGAAAGDVLVALAAARLGLAGWAGLWWVAVAAGGGVAALLSESAALQRLPAVRVGPSVLACQVIVPVLLAGPVTGQRWPAGADGFVLGAGLALTAAGLLALASSPAVATLRGSDG